METLKELRKGIDFQDNKIIKSEDGLLHRWTFNNTLKDECGSSDATIYGNVTQDNQQLHFRGGNSWSNNVFMGVDALPTDGSPFTIELWATQDAVVGWSRILSFGEFTHGKFFDFTWSVDGNLDLNSINVAEAVKNKTDKHLAPFCTGIEYHIAFVFAYKEAQKKRDGNWYVKCYKQDVKSGATLAKIEIDLGEDFEMKNFPFDKFHLGISYFWHDEPAASASYNEVRVWNRELSESELTDNAKRFYKHGETIKK